MVQRARDRAAGLNTAGFITGYPGSPLGTYDQALHQARAFLRDEEVLFQPGVNEDLAATSVWGTQHVSTMPGSNRDGVFAIWYGKGPGVDRSIDAMKHGNYAGASLRGGVLALAGDDHAPRSSTLAHQSDHAFIHCGMPILNPATVQEYLDLGIMGWALSRFSGSWVGFKCVTDTVESGSSVSVDADRVKIVLPDLELPPGGLNLSPGLVQGVAAEMRVYEQRLPAAQAFVRANGLDRIVVGGPGRRFGIVTTGKAYLDVRAALDALGIDDKRALELGLAVYKVAMTWPLEPTRILEFCEGLDEVLVIEEKRPIIEEQLSRLLVNRRSAPVLVGKADTEGAPLVQNFGELTPDLVTKAIAGRLLARVDAPDVEVRARPRVSLSGASLSIEPASSPTELRRLPTFCSGCPHNTSTRLPDGSVALGGIGCHGMTVWMPDRPTLGVTQMGGEGAGWIGMSPFTDMPHLFQNLGDGTYFHSGLLALRAAVASGVNITYKILLNGAIAMTGGQDIQGEVSADEVAHQVVAEGAAKVVVVSDDPAKWRGKSFPSGVTVHHRDELDRIQRELREVKGTTVIIYEQACAAEKRRKRKRGQYPDPDKRVVINERVCEGCGDCSVQSGCISIEPVETEFGRKRRINQSSCNKDYTCVNGYCPSFVTIRGGNLRAATDSSNGAAPVPAELPSPVLADSRQPYSVLVVGIGGTGIVTVGALLGMAAHLEGKGVTVLDVAGLAQKNGPVSSHVRIFDRPDEVHAVRIGDRSADLLIGADMIVSVSREYLAKLAPDRTHLVVNEHVAPTGEFALNPDLDLSGGRMRRSLERDSADASFVPATELATALMGDSVYTNLFLLGVAFQRGLLPVSSAALERAMELNGVAVEKNKSAFAWGRFAAHDLEAVQRIAASQVLEEDEREADQTLEKTIELRVADLTDYQNAAYAARYRALVDRVYARERQLGDGSTELTEAVARYYYKLMAYKDEYEVARLMLDPEFWRGVDRQFEGKVKIEFNLAPQIFNPRDPLTHRAKKRTIGGRTGRTSLKVLVRLRRLRGTRLDLFGRTAHRRAERALIAEYEETIDELMAALTVDNHELATEIAQFPEHIRGYDLVKDEHLRQTREHTAELLDKFRSSAKEG
jgi:indolepyruvate ferredoxin oxidoreductase